MAHKFSNAESWLDFHKDKLSEKQLMAIDALFGQSIEGGELVSEELNGKITTTISTRTPELELTLVLHH